MSVAQQLSAGIKCVFCLREVINAFFIQCAECADVNLCADCFAAGVEIDNHKNTHPYRVPTCLEVALFDNSWSVREELLLLCAIEKHGVGNWRVISENLNINKTIKQIEDHYWQLYLGVHGFCLPCKYIDGEEWRSTAELFPDTSPGPNAHDVKSIKEDDLYRIPATTGFLRGEEVQRDKEAGKAKDRNEINAKIAQMPGTEIPGFMPLREDFEVEYENDGELILAEMEFFPDDHPSEKELKLQVVRIYNRKLEERDKRRKFVIDRGLIDVKAQQAKEKRMTKEEREIVGKLRPFARFHSKEEHEALVEGLLKAQRLRTQIELYKTYRQMGLRTLEQARKFESDRKILMKNRKARDSNFSELEPNPLTLEPSEMESQKSKKRGRPPKQPAPQQSKNVEMEEQERKNMRSKPARIADDSSLNGKDISELQTSPGAENLTELELKFCAEIAILPYQYFAIKDKLVREAYSNGTLTREAVGTIVNLNEHETEKVYDFFVKEMHVNEPISRSTK